MIEGAMHEKLCNCKHLCFSVLDGHNLFGKLRPSRGCMGGFQYFSMPTLKQDRYQVRVAVGSDEWHINEVQMKKMCSLQPPVVTIERKNQLALNMNDPAFLEKPIMCEVNFVERLGTGGSVLEETGMMWGIATVHMPHTQAV